MESRTTINSPGGTTESSPNEEKNRPRPGFFPGQKIDNDPGGGDVLLGLTEDLSNQVSLIFMETIRDLAVYGLPAPTNWEEDLARNTVHEIGHQFNVARVQGEHRGGGNIMNASVNTVDDANFYFNPEDIAFLRFEHRTPGSR